jgi:hypothetical protein
MLLPERKKPAPCRVGEGSCHALPTTRLGAEEVQQPDSAMLRSRWFMRNTSTRIFASTGAEGDDHNLTKTFAAEEQHYQGPAIIIMDSIPMKAASIVQL